MDRDPDLRIEDLHSAIKDNSIANHHVATRGKEAHATPVAGICDQSQTGSRKTQEGGIGARVLTSQGSWQGFRFRVSQKIL